MRDWNLKPNDPLCLTLASDARTGPTDYLNDHVWELTLQGGDPPALALQTTYGLRARSMRLFPRFVEGDNACLDLNQFHRPPEILQLLPNYIALRFMPFPGIDVLAEYWVPQSHAVVGRIHLTNSGHNERQIRVEWVAQLAPTEGHRMGVVEIQAVTVLRGLTSGLVPVVFLTSGPKPGSGVYTSLALSMALNPEETRQFTWTQAALDDQMASFELARKLATHNWDAERSRLEMLNTATVDVHTGDADWDAVFHLAQKQAISLFVGPTPQLPYPSFVLKRGPDQGYSLCGDGSDYNHLWNGQPSLEAYYLSSLVSHAAPALVQGVLRNFLAVQTEDGFIDWKPGLAGQRSRLLSTPILASLAWKIYETTQDAAFLQDVFSPLLQFFRLWFTPEHDRDQDGLPEWDHPLQFSNDDHPFYSSWHDGSHGIDISTAETPSLCAFLYNECQSLLRIAHLLQQNEPLDYLEAHAESLKAAVEGSWNEHEASYFDWDRDTHLTTQLELLGSSLGSNVFSFNASFPHPVRLLIHIHSAEEGQRHPLIFVHGVSASGKHRVERITDNQFRWRSGWGYLTGRRVYASLEHIEVKGLEPGDQVEIFTAAYNCQDHSLLLPLWAGIPDSERASQMVDRLLTNPHKFWLPYGLPICSASSDIPDADICRNVNLPLNHLIGEGLLRYGYRAQAAELVRRLMNAVIQNLKRDASFRRYYHAETGLGSGERNTLSGFAPLGLFLETLGIRLIWPNRLALEGYNPFPWPVTVKYLGMTILRQREKTVIIFPDGQTAEVNDPAPRMISLETLRS